MSVVVFDEGFEAAFQLAFLGAWFVGGDRIAERPRTAPPVGALENFVDCPEIKEPQPLGTVYGFRQLVRFNDSTEIEKGAGHAGYRDGVVKW